MSRARLRPPSVQSQTAAPVRLRKALWVGSRVAPSDKLAFHVARLKAAAGAV